jgi:hypothetical protein
LTIADNILKSALQNKLATTEDTEERRINLGKNRACPLVLCVLCGGELNSETGW